MPKVDLTEADVTQILEALDQAHKSAKRAQNTGRSPQIKEIWGQHQRVIEALIHRLHNTK